MPTKNQWKSCVLLAQQNTDANHKSFEQNLIRFLIMYRINIGGESAQGVNWTCSTYYIMRGKFGNRVRNEVKKYIGKMISGP